MKESKIEIGMVCMKCPNNPMMVKSDKRSNHILECPECGASIGLHIKVENVLVEVKIL